jgi:hypothetical protein
MNKAFPSGAAIAGTLHKSKKIKTANALREHILNSGFNDSGTGKRGQNYNTIPKIYTHFLKKFSQCWRGFQRFLSYNFIFNVILLSQKKSLKTVIFQINQINFTTIER